MAGRRRPARRRTRTPTASSNRSPSETTTSTPHLEPTGCGSRTVAGAATWTRVGHGERLWHHRQCRGTTGAGAAGRASARKSRATDPGRGAAVTRIDGQQRVARVSESARGSGVEVAERDHEDHREPVEGVINPAARSQHDTGSNLHRRCRTGGVSSSRGSIYTPSHTSTYSPVPAKSSKFGKIVTKHLLTEN